MPGDSWFDDEAWDEEQWEAFLRDNDSRVGRYMELFHAFLNRYPCPPEEDAGATASWKEQLRTFLRTRGWRRDDLILPFFWVEEDFPDEERESNPLDVSEPFFDGESEDLHAVFDDFEQLPVYEHAFGLATDVLNWAHDLSGDVKDSNLVQFCAHIMQIPANVARGHGLGIDHDGLGGNIACLKRGLGEANDALDLLRRMKDAPYLNDTSYHRLYERAYEVRNELALYIQDLRDRFNLGID